MDQSEESHTLNVLLNMVRTHKLTDYRFMALWIHIKCLSPGMSF